MELCSSVPKAAAGREGTEGETGIGRGREGGLVLGFIRFRGGEMSSEVKVEM